MMQLFEEELKVQRHLKVSDVTEREKQQLPTQDAATVQLKFRRIQTV